MSQRQKRNKKLREKEFRRARLTRPRREVDSSNVELSGVTQIEITSEPIPVPTYDRMPEDAKNYAQELFLLAQESPAEAIPKLVSFCRQYPDVPILRNYLAAAYRGAGRTADCVRVMSECYEEFPEYLFGRLNLALYHVQHGAHQLVPELLNVTSDFTQLCPGRKRFHLSEAVTYGTVVALYCLEIGDIQGAKSQCQFLNEIDPASPLTHHVRRQIQKFESPFLGRRVLRR